ncbi:hypothetical protein TELCIR_14869 [Teladorsagia circumcincta]|uniref:CUB domain-containing protein n=1 Tax=Teladorsagia circumcincta TaxID=45464 RepID=A0A2G9U205_TELCI|nr:hypothetical protein TELCIR_14869 [Teladorsagia circumcincta]
MSRPVTIDRRSSDYLRRKQYEVGKNRAFLFGYRRAKGGASICAGAATGIYVRLDEFVSHGISKHRVAEMYFGNSYIDVQIDGGEIQSREVKGPYLVEAAATHEEFRAKNEIRIAFVKGNSLLASKIAIAYSTTIDKCGGEITAREGYISIPDIDGDFDCVWTLRENPGNGGVANTVFSELHRFLSGIPQMECIWSTDWSMEEVVWMKFRYVKPKEIESDEDIVSPVMRILFSRIHGGTTTSHVIQQPLVLIEELYTNFIWIAEGEPDKISINKSMFKIQLAEAIDNPNYNSMSNGRPGSVRVAGFVPPADIYLPFSRLEVSFFAPPRSEFRLTWQSVPKRDGNYTEGEGVNATKVYSCGSVMIPTWEWQELSNPKPSGAATGYENNMHCKWTIERPLMTGLRVKFTLLDLEAVPGCPFDFVSLVPDRDISESSGDDFQYGQKYCRPAQANVTLEYSYNKKCMWSIILASNRRIGYEVLDLDLEKTDQCTQDLLSVVGYA